VAQWYVLNDDILTPGKYQALGQPYMLFFALGKLPGHALDFTVEN
jgi:hypothetical protein